jgi:hypothetical protein
VTNPRSSWVWDRYSPERLMEFEAEVYGHACEAYDEALTRTFSRLGWSMPSSALHPFGVILERCYRSGRLPGPSLTMYLVSMRIGEPARKHGVDDEDILHVWRNPMRRIDSDDDFAMLIGPDTAGRMVEVGRTGRRR